MPTAMRLQLAEDVVFAPQALWTIDVTDVIACALGYHRLARRPTASAKHHHAAGVEDLRDVEAALERLRHMQSGRQSRSRGASYQQSTTGVYGRPREGAPAGRGCTRAPAAVGRRRGDSWSSRWRLCVLLWLAITTSSSWDLYSVTARACCAVCWPPPAARAPAARPRPRWCGRSARPWAPAWSSS